MQGMVSFRRRIRLQTVSKTCSQHALSNRTTGYVATGWGTGQIRLACDRERGEAVGGRHVKGAEEHAVAVAARAVDGRARRVNGQLAAHRKADVAATRECRIRAQA